MTGDIKTLAGAKLADRTGGETLTLSLECSPADLDDARAVREEVYHARLGLRPSAWDGEETRDDQGLVPVLRSNGRAVATARLLSAASPDVELRQLGLLPDWALHHRGLVEVARVAAVPRPGAIPYGVLLFALGVPWLLQHTTTRWYIGAVRLNVAPLYVSFGGATIGSPFRIPERGTAEYVLVHGPFSRMAQLASRAAAVAAEIHERHVVAQL